MGTVVISSLGVLGASSTAAGETTVSPTEPGSPPVVRDGSVTISVDVAALGYFRSNATSAINPVASTSYLSNTTTCKGDNPAGTNNSPRTTVQVEDPDGNVVLTRTSPARNIGLAGFFTNPTNQPLSPQPAPANANYLGDFPNSTYHGMSVSFDLAGLPAGEYTVTTTHRHMLKTGNNGPCTVGYPGPGGTVIAAEQVESDTFDYRPWQHKFVDVLGNGTVEANTSPAEASVRINGKSSGVLAGKQKFYALDGDFALPSDPETCAEDPASCLPAAAQPCNPDLGCVPRLMITQYPNVMVDGKANHLQGIFDLKTKAFIANAAVDGHQRVLMSLGPNDAYYKNLLNKLSGKLAPKGVDLPELLATQVLVGGPTNTLTLSLLNGLQVDPTGTKGGVSIRSAGTVQAGVLLDIYSHLRLSGPACVTNTASSANGDRRFTPNEDAGYTVRTSDLLPSVPAVGPLAAIVGGPVLSIEGDFVGATAPLVNTASAVIGVDTAADEPNGYPVWVEPFLSSPTHVASPKKMDFLGTATWSASETPVVGIGCLSVNFMVGTGVAIYNNPVRIGFDELVKAATKPNPTVRAVMSAVDAAANGAINDVTANPTVAGVLEQVVGALPLSSLP
ncbi:hypothetical protein DJ010_13850 [Nocardioides silvaticus]|uniref:Uncharacterized protein n=1 Tax=Nocardioides silvaticus TaxID=2201891 RepID=A0A316TCV3_9ACTN|nr:hypothetical protein [Nocardioides silvaticus]PWN02203.1 hypothetical protein DJ010_13850 [Nocardioides silvaticus]